MNDEQLRMLPMCECGKWHIIGMFRGRWFCGECLQKLIKKQDTKEKAEADLWLQEIREERRSNG